MSALRTLAKVGLIATVMGINFDECFSKETSKMVTINKLYLEGEKNVMANRNYFLPQDESPKYNLNLGLKLDVHRFLYLDNKVSSTTNDNQFRFVGLESEIGASKFGADLYFSHFSGHLLDAHSARRFPQENVIGVRFNLIGGGRR
jgi:hypothetical protein